MVKNVYLVAGTIIYSEFMPRLSIDIDKKLSERLKLTSQIFRLKEDEIIKRVLAKGTEEEFNNLLNELSTLYANNVIEEKELKKILGEKLSAKIKKLKNITERGFEDVKEWAK